MNICIKFRVANTDFTLHKDVENVQRTIGHGAVLGVSKPMFRLADVELDLKPLLFAISLTVGFCAANVGGASEQWKAYVWQATTEAVSISRSSHQLPNASAQNPDMRQGHVLAEILRDRDISSVAVTYSNSLYGKQLETAFSNAFRARGGTVAISISHQDGKPDYFAEMGALAAAGVEHLVVFGHLDRGGDGIIRTALDTGSFEKFVLGDEMVGDALINSIGEELNGSIATVPGLTSQEVGGLEVTEPGVKLVQPASPGDLASALEIESADNGLTFDDTDDAELTSIGDTTGLYRELEFIDGRFETVKIR